METTDKSNFSFETSTKTIKTMTPNTTLTYGKQMGTLAIQLYSVRDDMVLDPIATLKQLAVLGYKNVEHANYVDRKFYGYVAKEFKKILNDAGLSMPSGHVQMGINDWDSSKNTFTDQWRYTIEDAVTVGQQYLIHPCMDEDLRNDYDKVMFLLDLFNKCGEWCKNAGLKFGYHNHDFEFDTFLNDKLLYDIILEHTSPALVVQQMDIGNMCNGGGKALKILKECPDRFQLLHIKDEIKNRTGDRYESTVLGNGILPIKEILDMVRKSGRTSYFIIEQVAYQNKNPMSCAHENFAIMQKWGC